METVTGYVTGINGNLANVSFEGAVHKNEVGYILVDGKRLKGEVIRINNGVASMQIYEMSNGIKVGDPVEFTGELMSVELDRVCSHRYLTVCRIRCRIWPSNADFSLNEAYTSIRFRTGHGNLPHP